MADPNDLLPIGKITRLHGLRGGLFFQPFDTESRSLESCTQVLIGSAPDQTTPFTILEAAWMPKGWKLVVEGVTTAEAATTYLNQTVYISRQELPELDEAEYYAQDLVGCEVIGPDGTLLGQLFSIESASHPGMSSDRWWVKTPAGEEVAVPAVKRFIQSIDLQTRRIVVVDFDQLL